MKTIDDGANRHDWWWMATGFDSNHLAPRHGLRSWSGQSPDAGTAGPDTALEVAFQLAMLPFGQVCPTQVVAGGSSARPPGQPLVGDEVKFDFDRRRRPQTAHSCECESGADHA